MLRFWNSFAFALLCTAFFTSCGFIDLRSIGYSVEPGITDSLLSDFYTPVIVKFEAEMKKNDAEKILQVSSDMGIITGDLSWNGNNLYFVPVLGWTAGVRYTLSLLGTIRSVDGRELKVQHYISFYAVSKDEPPLLKWHYPADGVSAGTTDIFLEFHFSRPMDRLTVETALVIEGIGNKTFNWSGEDTILNITSDKALVPWTSYRWNLKDSAKSIDGVPLPKTYSGYFTTDIDRILPQVINVYPVLYSGGSWYPTGARIETGLASGHGIAVEFNKPMGENVQSSVRFEPSLTGKTEYLSNKSIVFIFSRDPEPETTYTMIISADTKDSEGLKIGSDYRINFVPDIPYINIISLLASKGSVIENITSNIVLPVHVEPGTGQLFFVIRFSLGFTTEEKLNTAQKIILTPFFPRTLSPVALHDTEWISDDRISMCWEGLKAGEDSPHYYKLTIPGGKSGITNGLGMYMKEDLIIYLEAVNEK